MPSDVGTTLSSVLSSTALRLSALVAAAMSAGYLWRAAVEPGGTAAKLSAAQLGLRVEPADVSFNTLDLLRPAEAEEESAGGGQADAVAQKGKPEARSSAQLVSVTVSAPQSGSAAPAPERRSKHPVRSKPTKDVQKRRPKPPAPPRRPNPPPPAPQPPPPPAPPPPPPAPPVAPPPPPPPVAPVETRPGRGLGDRNHRHTGPPGQQKPKKGKGKQGEVPSSPNQSSPPAQQDSGAGGRGNGRGGKKGKG